MAINMPSMDQIRGKIDVPEVRDATHFPDTATWAHDALEDAAVASAAEHNKILSKEESDAHRQNFRDAAVAHLAEDITARETAAGGPMSDDDLKQYAAECAAGVAYKFTGKEDETFGTTWRGRFSRWFGSQSKVKQVVMAGVVPAAITTGAALTGVGAIAGAAVGARFATNRLRGTPGGGEEVAAKRGKTLQDVATADEAVADMLADHADDIADGLSDDERRHYLAESIADLSADSMEQLSRKDRKAAAIKFGVATVSAVAGGVMRFTEINPLRDAVNAVGRRVFGAIGEVDSPVTFHDKRIPVNVHNPFGSEDVHTGGGSGAGESIADQADNSGGGGSGDIEDSGGGSGAGSDVEIEVDEQDTHLGPQDAAEDRVGVDVDEKDRPTSQQPDTDTNGDGSSYEDENRGSAGQDAEEDRVGSEENPVDEQDHPADQPTEGDATVETEIPAEAQDEYDDLVSAFDSHEGVSHADAEIRARQIVTNEDGAGDRFRAWIEGASDSPAGDHQPGTPGADNVTELPSAQPEEVTLNVPEGEGFENSLQQQYDLTDAEAAQAYQAMRPALLEAYNADPANSGMYMVGNDIRISSPGAFHLNPQASGALNQFLDTLHEENTLEEAA